jgi:hydrogenase maturation factor
VTEAVGQPVVVGQMLGWCERGAWVPTGGLRPGDRVVQIGATPVEGGAVLAEALASRGGIDADLLARARAGLREPGISIVEPALLAAKLGAVALHDPTEGGLATALHELADASDLAIHGIAPEAVLWFEPALAMCRAAGADPWGTLASGALLAGFRETDAKEAIATLEAAGFATATLGRAAAGEGVLRSDGQPLPRFDRDELSRVL